MILISAERIANSEKLLKLLKKTIFLIVILVIGQLALVIVARASHCPATDYDCQISEVQSEIDSLSPAHEYNKQELEDLRSQLKNLENRISSLSNQLAVVEADILSREEDLAYTELIFQEKTGDYYKYLRLYDPILPFLSSSDATSAFREISFRQRAADDDRKTMEGYVVELIALDEDKATLENNKASLANLSAQVGDREQFLSGEVDKTESYLAELSSKQEELIALKAGGFSTAIGYTPATLEPCSGPP